MIVEDESTIAYILKASLRDLDDRMDVHLALSGESAIELARKHHLDLLITDYYLEDTNALDLVKDLREISNNFTWILITAFGSEEMEENARELGAYAIYHKPFPVTDLKRAVLQILTGH